MEKLKCLTFLLVGVFHFLIICVLFLKKSEISVAVMPVTIGGDAATYKRSKQRMTERIARKEELCLREQIINKTKAKEALEQARQMTEVLEEHRLMICVVHKAGSSTWNTIVAGLYQREDLLTNRAIYKMVSILQPKYKAYLRVLKSPRYLKVFMARNPFERILSAFMNRILEPGLNSHQAKTYVPEVLFYNRGVRFAESDIFDSDGSFKIPPTFSEFINYLVTVKPESYDPHFKPVSLQCAVCHIDYDAVLLTDTFTEDLQYIMK